MKGLTYTGAGNIQDKSEASYSNQKSKEALKNKKNIPIHNDDCMSRGDGNQLKDPQVANPGTIWARNKVV